MCNEELTRKKTCYVQNFEQARSLNTQMNNVPVLAMTLTGGLWFAAGVTDDLLPEIRFLLLLFAGFCNVALILSTIRIRDVFHSYLEKIEEFHSDSYASGKPKDPKAPMLGDYSMISIYCALMAIAAVLSFFGAIAIYWPFKFSFWFGLILLCAVFIILHDTLFSEKVMSRKTFCKIKIFLSEKVLNRNKRVYPGFPTSFLKKFCY